MTNQQILEKAIQKAIDGGWVNEEMYMASNRIDGLLYNPGAGENGSFEDPAVLIFNHDFAKALWGDEWPGWLPEQSRAMATLKYWENMLQQMVVADDPIKYLGENI